MSIPVELLVGMNERQWQAHVEGLLRFYGWRHFHAPDNRPVAGGRGRAARQHVERGWPDLIAIRRLRGYGPELLVAELKTETGRLERAQREWRDDWLAIVESVQAAGKIAARVEEVHTLAAIAYHLWRPSDAEDVERELAGPYGIGVPVDRAEAAGGDVVDDQEGLEHAITDLEQGAAHADAIADLQSEEPMDP